MYKRIETIEEYKDNVLIKRTVVEESRDDDIIKTYPITVPVQPMPYYPPAYVQMPEITCKSNDTVGIKYG